VISSSVVIRPGVRLPAFRRTILEIETPGPFPSGIRNSMPQLLNVTKESGTYFIINQAAGQGQEGLDLLKQKMVWRKEKRGKDRL